MLQFGKSVAAAMVLAAALCAASWPAAAEDILVTQYKADPSGAPFAIALAKGFFKKAGVDVTGVISGAGGGASVRATMATEFGYGEVSPAASFPPSSRGRICASSTSARGSWISTWW